MKKFRYWDKLFYGSSESPDFSEMAFDKRLLKIYMENL